jgi:hypothetical protein
VGTFLKPRWHPTGAIHTTLIANDASHNIRASLLNGLNGGMKLRIGKELDSCVSFFERLWKELILALVFLSVCTQCLWW